jgi:nitrogen regulatory protein P-II 1
VRLVVAVIQPTKLRAVREALEKVDVQRITICDGQGLRHRWHRPGAGQDAGSATEFLRRVVLEIMVNDDFLERTVDTIVSIARSGPAGSPGDGRVFVIPAEQAIQVDDASRGPGAV